MEPMGTYTLCRFRAYSGVSSNVVLRFRSAVSLADKPKRTQRVHVPEEYVPPMPMYLHGDYLL